MSGGGWTRTIRNLDDLLDVDLATAAPTDGQALVYNAVSGLWEPETVGGGGGGGALTEIATVEMASAVSAITLSSIPGTYTDLVIVGQLRTTKNASHSWDFARLQVGNGTVDTGLNYKWQNAYINPSAAVASNENFATSFWEIGVVASDLATASAFATVHIEIFDYANTARQRNGIARVGTVNSSSDYYQCMSSFIWTNAAAAIDIVSVIAQTGPNLAAGSYLTLYGRG